MKKLHEELEFLIRSEANKQIMKYQRYHNILPELCSRESLRTGRPVTRVVKKPDCWRVDPKFNPFYVKGKAKGIAYSIAKKLINGTYSPNRPFVKEVPKKGGGVRKISIYQIPDAVISKFMFIQLSEKNKHRLSSFSYAYRDDRNVHYAIQDIGIDIAEKSRVFICEFDFSKFFDSIPHKYLFDQFKSNGFSISEREEKIIKSFLDPFEGKGIPQGTSISLFLANLACWRLDRELENNGVRFARYADDTIIWTDSYEKINAANAVIKKFSIETGVSINLKKSDGISQLVAPGYPSELSKRKESFDFLGYELGIGSTSIKARSVEKIKKQIIYILYKNLIQPLKYPSKGLTFPNNNQDLALKAAIYQIRCYLYGDLSELRLIKHKNGQVRNLKFKGLMSFYPIVDNTDQLKELDGWLVSMIYRLLLKRKLLLVGKMSNFNQFPFNVGKGEMVKRFRLQKSSNKKTYQIPSFLRIFNSIRLGIANNGISSILNDEAKTYSYSN